MHLMKKGVERCEIEREYKINNSCRLKASKMASTGLSRRREMRDDISDLGETITVMKVPRKLGFFQQTCFQKATGVSTRTLTVCGL